MKEEKKIRVFTKNFECLSELLNDETCQSEIQRQLKRLRMGAPPKGMRFKRTCYDALNETDRLNVKYFVQAYPPIEQNKSTLPVRERSFIKDIVTQAIRTTIEANSVVVEKGLVFEVKDSDKLEVGTILSLNRDTINVRLRKAHRVENAVWKYDETMAKFEKGELRKI